VLSELGIPTFNTPEYATEFWKRQNGITGEGATTVEGDVTHRRFANEENGTAVEQITLNGSGHTPDDKFRVYDKIWQFLEEHPKSDGDVAPSNDPTELIDERPNPLRGILDDIKTRGADGIADDVATVYRQVSALPDGSIKPSSLLKNVEDKFGTSFNHPITDFVRNSASLSKNGNQISLETDKLSYLPINKQLPFGSFKSMSVDDLRLTLDSKNGHPWLKDIDGVSLNLNAMGFDRSVSLKEISDRADSQGKHTYRFTTESPIPWSIRKVLFSPNHVDVDMQIDNRGQVEVTNKDEIKDDILGNNPVTRGYFDVGTDISEVLNGSNPNAGKNIRTDVGITAGFAGLSFLPPRYKVATSLAGTLIGAPATIHIIREHFPR